MKKRLLSLVLCLVMVFSLFPSFAVPASAVSGSDYAADGEWPGASQSGATLRYGNNTGSALSKKVNFSVTVSVSDHKITNVSISVTNRNDSTNTNQRRWNNAADSIASAYVEKLKDPASSYYIIGKDATLATVNAAQSATDSQYTTVVNIPTSGSYQLTELQKGYFEYDMKQALIAAIQNATAYQLKPDEEYIYTPVAMPSGGWKTDSNYGTEQLYALVNDEYVPVNLNRGDTFGKVTDTNGNEITSWYADDAYNASTQLGTLYDLYNGYYSPVQYQAYNRFNSTTTTIDLGSGDITHGNYTNSYEELEYTFDSGWGASSEYVYVYAPNEDGRSCWHQVYYKVKAEGVLSGRGGYFYTFYYYTNSMTGSGASFTSGKAGDKIGSGASQVTLLCDYEECGCEGYARIYYEVDYLTKFWSNSTSYNNGTDGKLYRVGNTSTYYNYMYTEDRTLACQAPDSVYSHKFNGNLYYAENGVTELLNANTNTRIPGSNASTTKGGLLYEGALYTRSIGVKGDLVGYKHLSDRNADGSYDLMIDSWATGPVQGYNNIPGSAGTAGTTTETVTTTKTSIPLDIVLVIDQSGSMGTKDMGETVSYQIAEGGKTTWTEAEMTNGTEYYCKDNSGNYHRVYTETGNVYEEASSARANWLFGYGHDGITVLVNGAPVHFNVPTNYYLKDGDTMRRVYMVTAGLDLHYGLYPYVYTDSATEAERNAKEWKDNFYWFVLVSPWGVHKFKNNDQWASLVNANKISWITTDGRMLGSSDSAGNSVKLDYSWLHDSDRMTGDFYTVSDTAPARLYYMDGNNKVYIGNTRNFGDDAFDLTKNNSLSDKALYVKNSSTTRVAALQAAVTQFANGLAQNAAENGVDHKLAIVGFAGNGVPGYSSGATAYNTTKLEYTDTGLFLNNGFVNYESYKDQMYVKDSATNTANLYQNVAYYVESGGSYRPIRYDLSARRWYYADTANEYYTSRGENKSGTFYRANLQDLTAQQYKDALVNVNTGSADAPAVNSAITDAINHFGYYGGTYTSYGLAMANNIFEQNAIRDNGKVVTTTTTYTYVDGEQQGEPTVTTSEETGVNGKRIVVVFTDGEPGGSGYESAIANEALAGGVKAKMTDGYDATVYTVGLYPGSVSSQVEQFMHQLSSEYTAQLTAVDAGSDYANKTRLNPNTTYYYQTADGKYYAAQALRNGESSLGWWRHNADGSYSPLTVRGKNGGGSDTLYDRNGNAVYGENANESTTYYNNGRPVRYEYRWYNSDGLVVEPVIASGDYPEGANTAKRYQFYAITGQNVNPNGEQYYYKVQNSAELTAAFNSVVNSIDTQTQTSQTTGTPPTPATTESVSYGAQNAMIRDVISSAFEQDPNATVEVQLVPAKGFTTATEDGTEYNVATPVSGGTVETLFTATASDTTMSGRPAGTNETITYTRNGKTIDITGYDFSKYYITNDHEGKLLRVIVHGLQPNGAGELYSNTQKSAIYKRDAETGAIGDELFNYNDPKVNVEDFTVTWHNGNTVLETDEHVPYASTPSFDSMEPTKETEVVKNGNKTTTTTYTFAGWEKTPNGSVVNLETEKITADTDYYAVFDSTVKTTVDTYHVTWMNGGTTLEGPEDVNAGEVPEYNSSKPAQTRKVFLGWTTDSSKTYLSPEVIANPTAENMPENFCSVPTYPVENYAKDGEDSVTFYAVFTDEGTVTPAEQKVIVEYSTKNLIAENIYEYEVEQENGGTFSKDGDMTAAGSFYFTPQLQGKNAEKGFAYDMTPMSNVSVANYITGAPWSNTTADKTRTTVTVVPGPNIYFDDSITSVTTSILPSEEVEKTFNYKAQLNETDVNTDAEQIEGGSQLTFTFTGTGIEVYAHTSTNSGKVGAYLYKDGQMVQSKIMNNNSENIDLYNVPTIRFDVDYGTYTLVIIPNKSADYRLDGVRVFNPGTEKTAQYLNVRGQLLDQYKENQTIFGALFLVGNTSEASVATYTKYGPKNEVYLDAGESVTFQVKGWTGGTYRIGLGAVSGDTISAAVSNGDNNTPIAHTVRGKTHVFYQVIPSANGSVVITNSNTTKGEILSITDLEIVGGKAVAIEEPELVTDGAAGAKLAVTRSLMTYVRSFDADAAQPLPADPEPTPSAEPTPTPSADPEPSPSAEPSPTPSAEPSDPTPTSTIGNWISQLFSNFVNSLFGSIARLFGGH